MTGGVTVSIQAVNNLKAKLATAEARIAEQDLELAELRQQHHDGILPTEIRQRFRKILSNTPGLGGIAPGLLSCANANDLEQVIEYLGGLLSTQVRRAEKAEDELQALNRSVTAVGELILRATEQATATRNR